MASRKFHLTYGWMAHFHQKNLKVKVKLDPLDGHKKTYICIKKVFTSSNIQHKSNKFNWFWSQVIWRYLQLIWFISCYGSLPLYFWLSASMIKYLSNIEYQSSNSIIYPVMNSSKDPQELIIKYQLSSINYQASIIKFKGSIIRYQ